ncbi:MAG TPA: NAD(P)/FAD-dependent oxidoreductase [Acidobacteriaceae bacterium]|nr:NAD(P)/FAD-dependent oxidoreductase [Acidobacteriaceae bacterium]
MIETDVLILGAGAAGLMCAIQAGRRGRRVLVLEHADRPGKKILISGGGRCNFTNIHARPENYISANPHFARSALARYTPQDFLALVESHRIAWHEKTLGQLFCDRSAHDILNMLLHECAAVNARVQLSTRLFSVEQTSASPARFHIETSAGPIRAQSVVIATGGLSIPKIGATSFGYDIARQFNHPIVEPRPGLVPFVFSAEDQAHWCDLAGLSAEVVASVAPPQSPNPGAGKTTRKPHTPPPAFHEKMLITHRGLSGPAILQISSYWQPGQSIELNLAPAHSAATDAERRAGSRGANPRSAEPIFAPLAAPGARRDLTATLHELRTILPARLASRWLELHAPTTQASPQDPLSNATLAALDRDLHAWRITPAGTEGYSKAEVTAGGVSTDALDARTLESRLTPGLYFIGEVVDVTGWLGGYNFQWAWASGVAAGQSA